MSGESVPLALPLARMATDTCEATTLYREMRKPLLRYLVCLGLTADEAQDVVQDTFVCLHQHLAAGGPKENIGSWLFRVAHNAARDRQNSYQRRHSAPLDMEVEATMVDEATPEQAVLEKEKFRRLRSAVRLLTDAERECLLLRAGGLRYREIAEILGMAISTVGAPSSAQLKKWRRNAMCDYPRKLIAWIDRELPESEADELERHVAVCGECREQLVSFEWASRAFSAYCEATFAAATRRKVTRRLPATGVAAGIAAAAAIAALLMLPRQHMALVPPAVPLAAEAPHTPIKQSQREYASARQARSHNSQRASAAEASVRASHVRNTSSFPAEPPIQIAIPADAMFPPGAVPPGMSFTAELTISADGSVERLGLRPHLAGFERRANQP